MNQIKFMKCQSTNVSNLKLFLSEEEDDFGNFLAEIIDWNLIFTMINTLSHSWDEPMVRMAKSFLISKAIETFSNKKMTFINDIGVDFVIVWNGKEIKIEFKHGKDIFQTDKTRFTTNVKLDSTNGKSSFFKEYQKTFDYLLLVDLKKVGIISYENLQQYISNNGDGRSVKIDKKDISIIKECSVDKTPSKVFLDDQWSKYCDDMIEMVAKIYYKK